ncbi:MAG: 1,4-alpha-glucan branching protein GlgB [Gemmatimonadota bacterium]|jgi:1,4-alpha-glucan branching enzyme|nr:1,4-alpha-glucan branching protein GlgB [Gemmatimonadota bacterium]
MATATPAKDIRLIVQGEHPNPFGFLGQHRAALIEGRRIVVRAFLPTAREAWVLDVDTGLETPMVRVDDAGFFEAVFPGGERFPYRLRVLGEDGVVEELDDPYSFPPVLGEEDLRLLADGCDQQLFRKLGAHPWSIDGVSGVRFAVWAPNATRVSVVGDFNEWDGRRFPMRRHSRAGVWDLFLPGLTAGTLYKYEIKPRHGAPFVKADPVAFRTEVRPATASIVHELGCHAWGDEDWMERRRLVDAAAAPMSIYEIHLGSWRWKDNRPMTYLELAEQLPAYIAEMGFTHVEFLPVMEHPFDPSWGYQVTGYYAPTSRFGTPDEFKHLVDQLHQAGIGVLLDWVPAHFPRDAAGLRHFDGTALYEHHDPRMGEHPDWGTMIFNYGRNEVRNFLVANAIYWFEEFHIDGLRVDAVASMLYLDYSREEGEWLPNRYGGRENLEAIDFFRELNSTIRALFPGGLMIAEESTAWGGVTRLADWGGLGFHFKWNMGWMNDFLRFIEEEPVHRKYHLGLLTFSLIYAFSETFILPISHDEVVHGKRSLLDKMPGDEWRKFANLRLSLGFMWTHPGKQLLFMGSEFGQWSEWSEAGPLDWWLLEKPGHAGVQRWVRDLNHVYRGEEALWRRDTTHEGFEWIDFHDVENSVISFRRKGEKPGDEVIVICNFTPVPRFDYRLGVPFTGRYREILNSDSEIYGGSNLGNQGAVEAEEIGSHGHPWSISLVLPPLATVVLKPASPDSWR